MTVLAVDLAAKYSAACLMDDNYTVLRQFDSWGLVEEAFIYQLTGQWMFGEPGENPDLMVVEDLPHGLKYSTLIKQVCRLQGRIAQAMHETTDGDVEDILFVSPATWRAHYGPAMKRGTGAEAVFPVSESFGYKPPDQTERARGNGGRTRARKVESDYCSAFLIARWAIEARKTAGTYDVPGTSRYATREIRKKEFDAENS